MGGKTKQVICGAYWNSLFNLGRGKSVRIGFFLAYNPDTELNNQGLGRYMAYLIKGFLANGSEVVIATPFWSKKSINRLFEDCEIDTDKVKFVTTEKDPVLLHIYHALRGIKSKSGKKEKKLKISLFIKKIILLLFSNLASVNNYLYFIAYSLILLIISLPLIFLKIVIIMFEKIIFFGRNNKKEGKLRQRVDLLQKKVRNFLNKSNLKNMIYMRKFYEFMYVAEVDRLINKINRQNFADVWYCPTIFWPEFNQIKGVKVTCVPDLIPSDYPVSFSKQNSFGQTFVNNVRTIEESRFCVVYDNFVKENLLLNRLGKDSSDIAVIPHGANTLDDQITICGSLNNETATTLFARSKIEQYRNLYFQDDCYLKNFNFADVKYIFYASQLRPNKNVLNLIKAYEYVLRRKHKYVKLFLTCDLNSDKDIKEYIESHRLQYDVISFMNVSNQTLASLYHCAELVVNPTLFEGGFPFTFVEGTSVGTPSVMSRIPQTQFLVNEFNLDNEMLFDPFDWRDIAEKMVWGLENRSKLFSMQIPMFNYLAQRSWDVVAQEYIQTFKRFIKNSEISSGGLL